MWEPGKRCRDAAPVSNAAQLLKPHPLLLSPSSASRGWIIPNLTSCPLQPTLFPRLSHSQPASLLPLPPQSRGGEQNPTPSSPARRFRLQVLFHQGTNWGPTSLPAASRHEVCAFRAGEVSGSEIRTEPTLNWLASSEVPREGQAPPYICRGPRDSQGHDPKHR